MSDEKSKDVLAAEEHLRSLGYSNEQAEEIVASHGTGSILADKAAGAGIQEHYGDPENEPYDPPKLTGSESYGAMQARVEGELASRATKFEEGQEITVVLDDGAPSRAVVEYHDTTLRLRIQDMDGGGTISNGSTITIRP